jgi:hypothetical protein
LAFYNDGEISIEGFSNYTRFYHNGYSVSFDCLLKDVTQNLCSLVPIYVDATREKDDNYCGYEKHPCKNFNLDICKRANNSVVYLLNGVYLLEALTFPRLKLVIEGSVIEGSLPSTSIKPATTTEENLPFLITFDEPDTKVTFNNIQFEECHLYTEYLFIAKFSSQIITFKGCYFKGSSSSSNEIIQVPIFYNLGGIILFDKCSFEGFNIEANSHSLLNNTYVENLLLNNNVDSPQMYLDSCLIKNINSSSESPLFVSSNAGNVHIINCFFNILILKNPNFLVFIKSIERVGIKGLV